MRITPGIARKWKDLSLSHRVITLVLIISFFFLSAFAFFTAYLSRDVITRLINSHNGNLARQISLEVNHYFQYVLDVLRLQTMQPEKDPENRDNRFITLRRQFSFTFGDIYWMDQEGKISMSLKGPLEKIIAQGVQKYKPPLVMDLDPGIFEAIKSGKVTISSVKYSTYSLAPYCYLTIPIFDSKGNNEGALAAEIDLRSLWTRLDNFQNFEGVVSIVDSKGRVLVCTDRRQIGQFRKERGAEPSMGGKNH
ncbi:MAG: cache domain-containing protein, partial [Thermodesulfobacteriota bacterium]